VIDNDEAWLLKMNIPVYSHGNRFNHDPLRKRKLLLHKRQIRKLLGETVEKGKTLVPLKVYWNKGRLKVELGLARGKTKGDKREDIKRRDANRQIQTALKRSR